MSLRSAAPFSVEPRTSRLLRIWLVTVHGLALFACLFNGLPTWSSALLACVVLASAWLNLHRAMLGPALRELRWQKDKGWTLTDSDGDRFSARLMGSSRVWTHFALLRFAAGSRRMDLMVWPDTLEPDDFRRLRVLLKIEGTG